MFYDTYISFYKIPV